MRTRSLELILASTLLFLTACSRHPLGRVLDHGKRYDDPLTHAQAVKEKDITFPLLKSAHNIYYGIYGEWQAYTMIVRFDAPVRDCLKHIDTVLVWDDKVYNRTSWYPRVTVTNVEPVDAGYLTPTSWFTPDKITRGVHVGGSGSHVPQIWVDLDKGTFYFRKTD